MHKSYASAVIASHSSPSMAITTNSTTPTHTLTTTIDINHPYNLSSVDHPGLGLINEFLTDKNYHHWSKSVQIALSAKLKLGFIDGSCTTYWSYAIISLKMQ